MLRWHLKSCSRPNVRVRKGSVTCQACGEWISYQAPLPDHENFRVLSQEPTERTCLDLNWPATVKYTQECILQYNGPDLTGVLVDHLGKLSQLVTERIRLENLSRYGFPSLPSEQHIRILLLSPARIWDHPLHGMLQIQDLNSRPYYEALSYTWSDDTGDASLNRHMYIGPAWDIMPITRSCSKALRRLRLNSITRPVWVDAICINQLSNTEKSHQIALMRKIYVKSIRCIVDLGEPSTDSDLALDGLNENGSADLETLSARRVALNELLRRSYFRRIWIIQGITSSPQVQVICGTRSTDLRLLRESKSTLPPWMKLLSTQIGLSQLESNYEGPGGLLRFLRDTRKSEASDPRDKIFALLGLTKGLTDLVADYDLTYSQVCTGLAAYYLRYQLFNHFICLRGTRLPTLPSWVPNWGDLQHDDWEDFQRFDSSNPEVSYFGDEQQWEKSKPLVRKRHWRQVLEVTGDIRSRDRLDILRLPVSQPSDYSEPGLSSASEYIPQVHAATGALIQDVAILFDYGDKSFHKGPTGARRTPIFRGADGGHLDMIMTSSAPVKIGTDSLAVIKNQHSFFHIRKEGDGIYRIMGDAMLVICHDIPHSLLRDVRLGTEDILWDSLIYTIPVYKDHINQWCESTLGTRELWGLFIDPAGEKGITLSPSKQQRHACTDSNLFFYRTLNLEEAHAQFHDLIEEHGSLYTILRQWVQNEGNIHRDDGSVIQLIQCVIHWGQHQSWQSLDEPFDMKVHPTIVDAHRPAWINANTIRQRWLAVESLLANTRPSSSSTPVPSRASPSLEDNSRSYVDTAFENLKALWEELTDNLICRLNAIADIAGVSSILFDAKSPMTDIDEGRFLDEIFDRVIRNLDQFHKPGQRSHRVVDPIKAKPPRPNTSAWGPLSQWIDSDLDSIGSGGTQSSPRCSGSNETPCFACINLQNTRSVVDWEKHWKIPKSRGALKSALEALHIQYFGDRRLWTVRSDPRLKELCLTLGVFTDIAARSLKMETVAII